MSVGSPEAHTVACPLAAGAPVPVWTAGDWEDWILLHTAVGAGDILVTTRSGNPGSSSSCFLPLNVQVGPWRVPPGTTITAMSLGGDRTINLFASPVMPGDRR